jgi:hypothetical protein
MGARLKSGGVVAVFMGYAPLCPPSRGPLKVSAKPLLAMPAPQVAVLFASDKETSPRKIRFRRRLPQRQ